MTLNDFCRAPEKASVALLGIGRANLAVLRWLQARGCTPRVLAESPPAEAVAAALAADGIACSVAPLPAEIEADVLVRSPALRPDIPPLAAHRAAGGLVTEESAITRAQIAAHVIGVTGSDGKTTTAALTAALLLAAGRRVFLGGNNGVPLLLKADEMRAEDFAVLELSSFQLMDAPRAADTAIVTNVTPNHLNWHRDMAEYIAAKCRIFDAHTHLVANAENEVTRAAALSHAADGGRVTLFSVDAPSCPWSAAYIEGAEVILRQACTKRRFACLESFLLAGRHNQENLLAAMAAAAPWLTSEAPRTALARFRGVPHRLQYVDTAFGVAYYNSSIDTSPTRTAAALAALGGSPIVIAGGRGKGVSLAPLSASLAAHAKAVCLYGEAAEEIAAGLGNTPHSLHTRFEEAFRAAVGRAAAGDAVLLSPGCTAFGEFRDFEERGEAFCRMVRELAAERK